MFKFVLDNGCPLLYCREQPLFGALAASLHVQDGQQAQYMSFEGSVQDEQHVEFVAEDKISSLRITAVYGDSTVAVRVDASLKQKEPQFRNIQPFFTRNLAVRLELSVDRPEKYMALYQHKPWWLRPKFFTGSAHIPGQTQMLLWQRGEFYFVMLAVCGRQYRTDLCAGKDGIAAALSSNYDFLQNCDDLSFVLSSGTDPHRCCEDAVRAALVLSGSPNCHRTEKRFPSILEYFGWCSWDAFYHEVNETGVLQKLEELQHKQLPVKWVLIDDGWSEADYKAQRLTGVDAANEKFHSGLKGMVRTIKKQYGIPYIGVWQAVMGYWNGIEPDSEADRLLGDYTEVLPDGRHVPKTTVSDSFGFWSEWHSYLKKCGVDFVKVDSQSAISIFQSGRRTYGEASAAMHRGLEASAALYFNKQIIHCMGMAPQDMWNRVNSSIARSSDDFVPTAAHGFREHAIQNAYNSLLQGQLYWGDWDMFWSDHAESWQNTVLRAVSGGPVYISDPAGKTDPQYILPLVLQDGRVLSCEDVGMPTADCLLEDPVTGTLPFKVFNRYRQCYVVAAFHISTNEQPSDGILSLKDIPSMSRQLYYVYAWKAHTLTRMQPEEQFSFTLSPDDAELFLLIPCQPRLTLIGLVNKYIAPAAIEEVRWQGDSCMICLKQGGTFGFVAENAPRDVRVNGEPVKAVQKNGVFYVECTGDERPVVCVTL
jgi:raffinose synthase